jgi:hypothetical protein
LKERTLFVLFVLLSVSAFCSSGRLQAATVDGSISLHDSTSFSLTTSRIDDSFTIEPGSTDIALDPIDLGGESFPLTLILKDGTQAHVSSEYGLVGPGTPQGSQKVRIEVIRDPGRYSDITWQPEGFMPQGLGPMREYRYKGLIRPVSVSFDPPIVFYVMQGSKKIGTTGSIPIREVFYNPYHYGVNTTFLHLPSLIPLRAHKVTLNLPGGLQKNDEFELTADGAPIKRPAGANGVQIVLLASAIRNDGVPIALSYGPDTNNLYFYSGASTHSGFDCNDVVINGSHSLTTSAFGNTRIIRIPTKWYRPFGTSFSPVNVTLNMSFDDASIYLYDLTERAEVNFLTIWDNRLSVVADNEDLRKRVTPFMSERMFRSSLALSNYAGANAWSLFTVQDLEADKVTPKNRDALIADLLSEHRAVSTVKLPIAWSGNPVVISGTIVPPDGASLGSYDGRIVLKGVNLAPSFLPIRCELYDPLETTKQTFAGVTLALVTSYLGWFLFDRRRKQAENLRIGKDSKVEFLRDHYLDLIELRKRLQPKLEQKDLQWSELVTDLNWLMHKHLQGIFSTETWIRFERYFSAQDAQGILQLLRGALIDVDTPES